MGIAGLPTLEDVADAAARVSDWLIATPCLESQLLNQRVGHRVLIKAECLQHGGSFKIRGALNRLLRLSHAERAAGVVAFSSGNHAQSVALAGKWLGVPVTIVMPSDAPSVKQFNTRMWGAEVVLYDRQRQDRERLAAKIAEQRGAALVPPFDHPDVIAGQGTVGRELAQYARRRILELSRVYVPCGGGGLIAGSALAVRAAFPDCAVIPVEPEAYDDTLRSLRSGERQVVKGHPVSLCDGLMARAPGVMTFALNRRLLAPGLTVTDAEVRHAMAFALRHLRVVLEPSGAVGLAAVLKGPAPAGGVSAVVLSGGNVEPELLRSVLAEFPSP
jgi:threonine dehydratase